MHSYQEHRNTLSQSTLAPCNNTKTSWVEILESSILLNIVGISIIFNLFLIILDYLLNIMVIQELLAYDRNYYDAHRILSVFSIIITGFNMLETIIRITLLKSDNKAAIILDLVIMLIIFVCQLYLLVVNQIGFSILLSFGICLRYIFLYSRTSEQKNKKNQKGYIQYHLDVIRCQQNEINHLNRNINNLNNNSNNHIQPSPIHTTILSCKSYESSY